MALETSPDAPAPLRQISSLLGGYIARLGAIWIEAEVAELNRRPGICFLTLRDLEATISIRATCHVSVLDACPAPIAPGARVVVQAKPSFYEPSGALALQIREIRPQGEGELLAQLERRKQLLAAEGLFDPRLKRSLPFLPHAIGLVTGRGSAAERDVLENARRRWPGVRFIVRHALMQGAGSARDVIRALDELEGAGPEDAQRVDVIVIARGGGSLDDLLPFSDEALIRRVAQRRVPLVSAIGHEPDTPLLDFVADLRASTPTDAAKRLVPDVGEELAGVDQARRRASHAVRRLVEHEAQQLAHLRSRPVLARPTTVVDAEQTRVDEVLHQARRRLSLALDHQRDAVASHLARVQALSPLATLKRGYAVAQTLDGHVLGSVVDVPPEFVVRLADGTAHVQTQSTVPSATEAPHDPA